MDEAWPTIPSITGLVFMKLESERVHRKNLREVGGRPLYQWIFDVLRASRYVQDVILNTDSEAIADEVSNRYEVRIHMRPESLLNIDTDEANQIIGYDLSQATGEFFLQTHSTNPLLEVETLDRAVRAFFYEAVPNGFDSLFSVTPHQKRFFFENGEPVHHQPSRLTKTQHLRPLLEENSCIYLFSRASFNANSRNRIGARPFMWPMRGREATDIDTEEDLEVANSLLLGREALKEET